ncbi:MAG: Spy/CpxP family protein refolding chaperone [Prosthecobacter sp.]|nr:Spy/CpxP family protein refolding chaperone [Prosthecobacter sp.]
MRSVFLVVVLLVSQVHAGPEAWLEMGLITPEMITKVAPELELTVSQEAEMKKIVEAAQEASRPLGKAIRDEKRAFSRTLRKPKGEIEETSAALTRLMNAEAAMKQLQLRTLLSLRDLLSMDQIKKVVTLAPSVQGEEASDLEIRLRQKARKLREAVDSLGVPATNGMRARGEAVEDLIRAGDLAAADLALDELVAESEMDDAGPVQTPDFTQYDPGDTDVSALQQRYGEVEKSAQKVISIPLVKQLITARQALEEAKVAEDAETVGRILTWAEGMLGKYASDQ